MKDWIKELCPELADWQTELIAEQAQKDVAAEREACAKVCDEVGGRDTDCHAWDAAAAIRARSNT